MKKKVLIIILSILLILLVLFIVFRKNIFSSTPKEKTIEDMINETEENEFLVNSYSIFGTHFNINACVDKVITNETSLVLKNLTEEIDLDSNFYNSDGKTCFKISNKNNTGIDLETLIQGNYILMVKESIVEESNDKEPTVTNYYYNLKNGTQNSDLEYYTITKNGKNNKININ